METKNTLKYIQEKFQLDFNQKLPIKLSIDRYGLTDLFGKLGFRVGAEIGVERGLYSKWLCYKMRRNKPKLFLIDSYIVYNEYVEKHDGKCQSLLDVAYKKAKERLEKFNCEFVKKTSMEALEDFLDNSLDFVYIDANHTFEYVVNDIAEWSKKVRPGGIISGHDFLNSIELEKKDLWGGAKTYIERLKLCQVKEAVLNWTKANEIKPWFITIDKTWFWIKP